ncbi:unnamed protein product [Sphenostylis stenocarpa]|uniref:Uncharacterized protein n=1 Tax=Sphenostylis stenocarpa TaxID=92480 RepID=A0AA87B7F2_9FABA|nr:unnamed protein product [Sphenostylis stenocarpa]
MTSVSDLAANFATCSRLVKVFFFPSFLFWGKTNSKGNLLCNGRYREESEVSVFWAWAANFSGYATVTKF